MRGVALTVVAVGSMLILASCGGRDDDAAAIRAVFARLDAAQRRNDAEQACEKVFLVAEANRSKGESGEEGEEPGACRDAFASAAVTRSSQVRRLHTTVESVAVDGSRATAELRSEVTRTDGSTFINTYTRDLVRRDGAWRIRISPEG